jgi:hypothetical protein
MSATAPARALPVNGEPGSFQTFFKGLVRIFGPNRKDPARLRGETHAQAAHQHPGILFIAKKFFGIAANCYLPVL